MKTTKSYTLSALCALFLIVSACSKSDDNDGKTTTATPIEKKVTYTADVSKIMTNYCTTCHAGAAASAGLDLTTYANTKKATQNSNLVSRMNNTDNPMPPSGVLSPEIRQLIDKWVKDGFPEN